MAKRQIIPTKFTVTVVGGVATIPFGNLQGTIRHLVIIADPGIINPKGELTINDLDNAMSIFMDPKPTEPKINLDFYEEEMSIPVNGDYELTFSATTNGDYEILLTITEPLKRIAKC